MLFEDKPKIHWIYSQCGVVCKIWYKLPRGIKPQRKLQQSVAARTDRVKAAALGNLLYFQGFLSVLQDGHKGDTVPVNSVCHVQPGLAGFTSSGHVRVSGRACLGSDMIGWKYLTTPPSLCMYVTLIGASGLWEPLRGPHQGCEYPDLQDRRMIHFICLAEICKHHNILHRGKVIDKSKCNHRRI